MYTVSIVATYMCHSPDDHMTLVDLLQWLSIIDIHPACVHDWPRPITAMEH